MRARAPGTLLLLVVCAAPVQALANVRASLDTPQIAVGNTVQLTLEHDGRTSGQPDLTPLVQDFDILGTTSSISYDITNGSASEKSEVVLTLAPKVTGQLTIPALSWGGEQSQPLSLTVTGPGSTGQAGVPGAASAAKVFIETSTSPQQPYVEAAVHLTVRLFTAETLYHADLELPDNGNVLVKQIGPDENSQTERNGRTYQVFTRQYLLFALRSGKLVLKGPVLDADVATSQRSPLDPFGGAFFGGPLLARPMRVYGNPIALAVRPRPAGTVGSYWLPARDVTFSAAWNPAKLTAQTGDPVTLDLDLQATGLTAAQLPDVASLLSLPSGLKAYPDQPKLADSTQGETLIGSRDQTIALMADSPGHYTIPALTISWWDTQTNQARAATLPGRTLTILPAPGSAPTAAAAPPPVPVTQPGAAPSAFPHTRSVAAPQKAAPLRSPSEWEWISLGLAVVWLSTLTGWLWSRRKRAVPLAIHGGRSPSPDILSGRSSLRDSPPPDPSKERAAFRAACETNDAHAARAHLLAWASARWGATPTGVNAVAARVGDATVAELLRDLDRACYAGGEWQGRPLAAALAELPAQPVKTARARDGLAPLYR
ncbi:MAG: BatD family protein [Steroidobacteraceae bacterium]